jgi:hypothetical protein
MKAPRPTSSQDVLRILFAGPEAATADHNALAAAQQMSDRGTSPEDIWRETGWGRRGLDDWITEIDDSRARIVKDPSGRTRLDHPDLEAAYPGQGIADYVRFMPLAKVLKTYERLYGPHTNGGEDPLRGFHTGKSAVATNEPDYARDAGLHELQHHLRMVTQGQRYPDYSDRAGYIANPHEVEARDVELRSDLTQQQRRQVLPQSVRAFAAQDAQPMQPIPNRIGVGLAHYFGRTLPNALAD